MQKCRKTRSENSFYMYLLETCVHIYNQCVYVHLREMNSPQTKNTFFVKATLSLNEPVGINVFVSMCERTDVQTVPCGSLCPTIQKFHIFCMDRVACFYKPPCTVELTVGMYLSLCEIAKMHHSQTCSYVFLSDFLSFWTCKATSSFVISVCKTLQLLMWGIVMYCHVCCPVTMEFHYRPIQRKD